MSEVNFEEAVLSGGDGVTPIPPKKERKRRKKAEKEVKPEVPNYKLHGDLPSEMYEVDTEELKEYKIQLLYMTPASPILQSVEIKCVLNIYGVKYLRDLLFKVEHNLVESGEPQNVRMAYTVYDKDENGEVKGIAEMTCALTGIVGVVHNLPLIRSISAKN